MDYFSSLDTELGTWQSAKFQFDSAKFNLLYKKNLLIFPKKILKSNILILLIFFIPLTKPHSKMHTTIKRDQMAKDMSCEDKVYDHMVHVSIFSLSTLTFSFLLHTYLFSFTSYSILKECE